MDEKKVPAVIFVLVFSIYGFLFFPHAYFRHDDWLILGNAVIKVPEDWGRLWKATLYYGDLEVFWFFRPFFKGMTYLFYKAFELRYQLWLITLFTLLLLAVALLNSTILFLTQDRRRAVLFSSIFLGSWLLHFGSVVWMGEGMMNIPQILLLSVSLYAFCKGLLETHTVSYQVLFLPLSLCSYLLAIGFKESAVAHPGLLCVLLLCEPAFSRISWKRKTSAIIPFAATTAIYLVWRLGLPANAGVYHTNFSMMSFARPIAFFVGPMVTMWVFLRLVVVPTKERAPLKSQVMYSLFFAVMILPYLGHGVFSPGWLIIPGIFGSLLIALCIPLPQKVPSVRWLFGFGTTSAVSLLGIILYLNHAQWWHWADGGKKLKELVVASPDTKQHWVVFDCPNSSGADLRFERVVTFEAGMNFLWRFYHESRALFTIVECSEMKPELARKGNERFFKFTFPELEELDPQTFIPQKTASIQ